MDYGAVLEKLLTWARDCSLVRAVVLVGSAARGEEHQLSDRDIEIYSTDVDALLRSESWWDGLGEVLVVERLFDASGNPTRLIYYAGGKIDFTLKRVGSGGMEKYLAPYRVLLDKDGLAEDFRLDSVVSSSPEYEVFLESINWAWAAAIMEAKAIVRDEPWKAKLRDEDLKRELLRMIEWDHLLRYGTDYPVHFLGGRMREWVDKEVQNELDKCWGSFDQASSAQALYASVCLYSTLAARTGKALGYPDFDHERLKTEVMKILDSSSR